MLRSFILFAGLVLALGLAGCPQQAEQPAGDAETTEQVESAPADQGSDAPADSGTDGGDAPADDESGTDADGSDDDS